MNNLLLNKNLESARNKYKHFVQSCLKKHGEFSLTPKAEASPFALCFGIFALHLIGESNFLKDYEIFKILKQNIEKYRISRSQESVLKLDKPYLQLLTFSLSCLSILDFFKYGMFEEFINPLISKDIRKDLNVLKALEGKPQSGNFAMFMAILLIHANEYMGKNTQTLIDEWVELHIKHMNKYGFWGPSNGMTHLQFQNGYHQYEIFEYLDIDNPKKSVAAQSVSMLSDQSGQFAPYPGGGGCYDYDAVSLLTNNGVSVEEYKPTLMKTVESIIGSQNADGGFGESQYIRPRKVKNVVKGMKHLIGPYIPATVERTKYFLTLLRPKHDRVHTHWSRYSREWSESDLWDSWFRMMAIARIQTSFFPELDAHWGFINYPGIGYYHGAK